MSSFVRVVLQALLAAMSQVAQQQHMRTRLNRGDSNRKTFIGMAKRCPWLLDRGGCLIEFHLRFFSTIIILGL